MTLTIEGLQEAQQANAQAMAVFQPRGGLETVVHETMIAAHRYAVSITHVDTGALRASHRMTIEGPLVRRISLDPMAVNPRSEARPAEYGVHEHSRGGEHAFYRRTQDEYGPVLGARGVRRLIGMLPR